MTAKLRQQRDTGYAGSGQQGLLQELGGTSSPQIEVQSLPEDDDKLDDDELARMALASRH